MSFTFQELWLGISGLPLLDWNVGWCDSHDLCCNWCQCFGLCHHTFHWREFCFPYCHHLHQRSLFKGKEKIKNSFKFESTLIYLCCISGVENSKFIPYGADWLFVCSKEWFSPGFIWILCHLHSYSRRKWKTFCLWIWFSGSNFVRLPKSWMPLCAKCVHDLNCSICWNIPAYKVIIVSF